MKLCFLVVIFLIALPVVSASIVINEIMYDPEGADANHEWVEISNNGDEDVNLEGWKFFEANVNHGLVLISGENMTISPSEHIIIVQNPEIFNQDYQNYTGKIFDSSFSLGNTGEYIAIKNSSLIIIDEVNYTDISEEGRTICRMNNIWMECIPTPGGDNVEYQEPYYNVSRVIDGDTFELANGERVRLIGINAPENFEYYHLESKNRLKELVEGKQVILEGDIENEDVYGRLLRYVYVNNTFVNLAMIQEGYARAYPYGRNLRYGNEFAAAEERARNSRLRIWLFFKNIIINEIMYNPEGSDDNKEYIEMYMENPINLENYVIQDRDSHDSLRMMQFINSSYALIVEDGFDYSGINASVYSAGPTIGNNLNNDEDLIIMKYSQGDIIDAMHYHNELGGNDNGMSLCRIANLWMECVPTSGKYNEGKRMINSSHLSIDRISIGSDKKAKFGEMITVRITVYKGDTSKYNLDLYIVDENDKQISKRSEMNVMDKFTNYTFMVPLQIDPNCNMKIGNGGYKVVLEGLNEMDEEDIEIEGITGSLCQAVNIQEQKSSEKISSQAGLEDGNVNNEITSAVLYESSDMKAKSIGLLFFSLVLLAVIIYIVFYKNL